MSLINKTGKGIRFPLNINRVIIFLTLSDFFIVSGWGLINPIFAVFVTKQIKGAGIEAVGLALTIYLLLKSGFQIPLANIIDKIKGERDDFLVMFLGMLITGIVPIFYIFIKTVPQLFLVQAIHGIGGALSYPAWLALFTRHIDKNKEGWEWSLYFTTVDLSAAAAAAIGGYFARYFGFSKLFLLVSFFSFLGCFLLLKIRADLRRT